MHGDEDPAGRPCEGCSDDVETSQTPCGKRLCDECFDYHVNRDGCLDCDAERDDANDRGCLKFHKLYEEGLI